MQHRHPVAFAGATRVKESTRKPPPLSNGTEDTSGDYRPMLCKNYKLFGKKDLATGKTQYPFEGMVVPGHRPSRPLMTPDDFIDICDRGVV